MTENKPKLELNLNLNYTERLEYIKVVQNPKSTGTIVTDDYCLFC